MKLTVIFITAAFIVLASADVGLDSFKRYSGVSTPAGSYLPPRVNHREASVSADNYVPKVYKHVYVHSAPEEVAQQEKRVIRVPGGDKHVNIIFVKTPSQSGQSETEVVLPDPDQQKNIVYVLLNKQTANDNIKITRPQPKAPAKPEVHFIRYDNAAAAASPSEQDVPQTPAGLYGAPDVDAPVPVLLKGTQSIAQSQPKGLYETPSLNTLPPQRQSQSIQGPSRVYGTPEDVPPPSAPSGLYGTPTQ